jgi:nitroimidazol reductase NimA-like FMN-containing flavoprotein (pyridoxamine 5'-phosphate oxidase superfamily)
VTPEDRVVTPEDRIVTPEDRIVTPAHAPSATIRQHAERSVPEERAAILAAGLVAHVGFVEDGWPVVIPMTYHFDRARPDRIWIHGARGSRLLRHAASGAPLCVEVTIVDGLVHSRTAKYHSMNYRSAVVHGRGREIEDTAEKLALFEQMIARYTPGRAAGRDYEAPPTAHLGATSMIEVRIEDGSAKTRSGGPKGPRDEDPDAPGSAGVAPAPASL